MVKNGKLNTTISEHAQRFSFGQNLIDFRARRVYKAGELQDVTKREFSLLEYFLQHPGEVVSRDRLLNEIWGYEFCPITRTVDNHIMRLRKHIEPRPERPIYIKTIRGAGYVFDFAENGTC